MRFLEMHIHTLPSQRLLHLRASLASTQSLRPFQERLRPLIPLRPLTNPRSNLPTQQSLAHVGQSLWRQIVFGLKVLNVPLGCGFNLIKASTQQRHLVLKFLLGAFQGCDFLFNILLQRLHFPTPPKYPF